jgi:F-type H+-transporting ATPase subunit gamma
MSRLGRTVVPRLVGTRSTFKPAPASFTPTRTFATEQQLKLRMNTVNNIKKITKAMKMVAAAKLRSVQSQLELVRSFQQGLTDLWPSTEVKEGVEKRLFVVLTSDRGLCGSVNSAVVRKSRTLMNEALAQKKNVSVVLLGDKGKSALERVFGKSFLWNISEAQKAKTMSFRQASQFADQINKESFDRLDITYNRFKNLLAFETVTEPIYSFNHALASLKANPSFNKYEVESGGYSNIIKDLYEFRVAVRIFHAFQESATSEQSARMNAMGNSSKSANEMMDSLRLIYNRTRQAKITTELIEIISGAIAAEAKVAE